MELIIGSGGHEFLMENIVRSENCFLFDNSGKRFIDLESGVWCTCLGHNNKRINEKIQKQINEIMHTGFCYVHPQLTPTAKKLLDISGILKGKCEFLSSGSEAVEFGMRAARLVSEKPLALTFSDSYFGAYGDAASKMHDNWILFDWLNCSCARKGIECKGECDEFLNLPFEDIGIFLFEPGSSSGFVRFPSFELISKVLEKIRATGGLIMVNEITTGTGRTGKWFGYQHYQFVPDIVALGKGIGNGYPVSACIVSEKTIPRLERKGFRYAQSHQNDPLGVCIANEVIQTIEEDNLLEEVNQKGNYLMNKLRSLINNDSAVKDVRGRGMMIAIEFHKNAHLIYKALHEKGFIVGKRPNAEIIRLDPSFTIEFDLLQNFISEFHAIVKKFK